MSAPFLSIAEVSKTYPTRDGEIFAVDNVSLDLTEGGFVSLLGPSGCGKSTLLLMCAGLIPYDSGTISIAGNIVDKPYIDLGVIFQDANLLDWRTVLNNLMIQAEIRRMDKSAIRVRALELLADTFHPLCSCP